MFRQPHLLEVDQKGIQDRVSNADRNVELAIRKGLAERFPDDGFLGEEYGADDAADSRGAGTWVVDPIDGTDCFVFGIPSWCISIAWTQSGRTEIGVVFDPVHDEIFTAARGHGAFVNRTPIKAADATDFGAGLVAIGHSLRTDSDQTLAALSRLLSLGGLYHRCGSGALSLAWVAAGRLIGYYEPHMNSWDCLAGLLLVEEAGGWTNDFLDGDGLRKGNAALAAAPALIEQIKFIGGIADNDPSTSGHPQSGGHAREVAAG